MSSLAGFMLHLGYSVEGSDINFTHITDKLQKSGAIIHYGHTENNVDQSVDMLVYSGAINEDNAERIKAKKLNIPQMERAEFLAQVASEFGKVISVSGTHGKTTTTCMLADIFQSAQLKPTVHLGGESVDYGNALFGGQEYFITEACEYRNSFATLHSNVSIITNIESDHLDYYKDINDINNAFVNFANNTSEYVVLWQNRQFAKKISHKKVVVVGFKKSDDFFVCNVKRDSQGRYSYVVKFQGKELGKINLNVCGIHNVKNSACAFAVAYLQGIKPSTIITALARFKGVLRRYELIGEINNIPIIADYAHHPTEILNSIKSSLISHSRILCVFQPHTYSRTLKLMQEFITCFEGVEKLVVYKTYEAREKRIEGGDAYDLYNQVQVRNKMYSDDVSEVISMIEKSQDYDLVLVLGAGDIYDLFKIALMQQKCVD